MIKTFTLRMAQNVRAYGLATVWAETAEAALELARTEAERGVGAFEDCDDLEWGICSDETVLEITEAETGEVCYQDIRLTQETNPYIMISSDELTTLLQLYREDPSHG